MASPGNRHCANCIDTLSFPMSAAKRRLSGPVRTLMTSSR